MLVRERLATGAFDADTVDGATLAAAIGRALDDPSVADSALRWQHRVAADDGVAGAVAAIESHAARHPPVIERPA
jgi:UDP:flavonoid glycosyltransferase YjiC (YdhE family)